MTTHNHWGIHLSTDEPTTGVYTGNDLAWEFLGDFIDVECEKFVEENPDAEEWELDFTGDTQLYGDWLKGDDGKYYPDPNGEYALIYNSNDNFVQVVYSTVIRYGRMCSPCFPGQVDARLDDPDHPTDIHIQAYYALPDWATYERD